VDLIPCFMASTWWHGGSMMAGWLCTVPLIGRAEDGWACSHEECAVDDGLRRAGGAHTEESRVRRQHNHRAQRSIWCPETLLH